MDCSTCNAKNQAGNFCSKCGNSLVTSVKTCLNCGNDEILGEYCQKCGSRIEAKNVCKSCNAIDQTGNFCRKCGCKMSIETVQTNEGSLKPQAKCSKCGKLADRYDEMGFARMTCVNCGAGGKNLEWI